MMPMLAFRVTDAILKMLDDGVNREKALLAFTPDSIRKVDRSSFLRSAICIKWEQVGGDLDAKENPKKKKKPVDTKRKPRNTQTRSS